MFKKVTDLHKKKMCNDAYTQMAGCISTTFVFDKIVPSSQDPPYDKEVFGTMYLGPYAEDLLLGPGQHGQSLFTTVLDHDDYDVNKGPLTQVRRNGFLAKCICIHCSHAVVQLMQSRCDSNCDSAMCYDVNSIWP